MSLPQQRLLVVDDEAKLRSLLKSYLAEQGFLVEAVEDSSSMDQYLADHEVDLIILDLMLPGEDGLSIGRRLRTQGNQPIIILSARSEEIDRIIGLEVGADDYLAKPFNPRELLARIRSVLRRCQVETSGLISEGKPVFSFGTFRLDTGSYQLTKEGKNIPLSIGEYTLLQVFLEHPNRVLSRDTLLEMTKGYNHTPMDRSIDICVGRLRRKIEENPTDPIYLRTIWGAGYLFSLKR